MKKDLYCFIIPFLVVLLPRFIYTSPSAFANEEDITFKENDPLDSSLKISDEVKDVHVDAGDVLADTSHTLNELKPLEPEESNETTILQDQEKDIVLPMQNESVSAKNGSETKIRCILKDLPDGEIPMVHLVNSSALVKALAPVPNVTSGECAVVMFYSPYCVFSAKAAPHFNAISRFFPQISFYAIDAITYTSLNMRYGLVAVPTVLLFHNGKASVKYNDSEPTLDKMVVFLKKYTGISPEGNVTLSPEDSIGPISPVPLERRDYVLILSWLFTITFCCVWFAKSALCQRMVECIRNTWQEAEAQHEHED